MICRLDNISSQIQQCQNCELCQYDVNKKDISRGFGKLYGWKGSSKPCKFLFVGINPSNHRFASLEHAFGGPGDNQGTGKKFTDMLRDIGIFEELYCTNLVKCSTVDNNVSNEHMSSCIQFLFEEISLLKPEKVIAIGSQIFGFLNKKIGLKLRMIRHPSYVYRYKKITEDVYKKSIKDACL